MTQPDKENVVEITQADRDAAAAFIRSYWPADEKMLLLARSYENGHSQGIVRAFARHRINSSPSFNTGVAQERAAIVAWMRAEIALRKRLNDATENPLPVSSLNYNAHRALALEMAIDAIESEAHLSDQSPSHGDSV